MTDAAAANTCCALTYGGRSAIAAARRRGGRELLPVQRLAPPPVPQPTGETPPSTTASRSYPRPTAPRYPRGTAWWLSGWTVVVCLPALPATPAPTPISPAPAPRASATARTASRTRPRTAPAAPSPTATRSPVVAARRTWRGPRAAAHPTFCSATHPADRRKHHQLRLRLVHHPDRLRRVLVERSRYGRPAPVAPADARTPMVGRRRRRRPPSASWRSSPSFSLDRAVWSLSIASRAHCPLRWLEPLRARPLNR